MRTPKPLVPLVAVALGACSPATEAPTPGASTSGARPPGVVRIANVAEPTSSAFEELAAAFAAANPGYGIELHHRARKVDPGPDPRVLFVHGGVDAQAAIGRDLHDVEVGDVVLLRPGETLLASGGATLVAFRVPDPFPDELPSFIRPEWDPKIMDAPGGCATEDGAYRRILLTWLEEVGPYVYHGLNAHRVRITDSFSHYHPLEGGFDELYLVQGATPDARVLTSERVARIEDPGSVTREQAAELLTERPLSAGDLVYLPRGTVHRGLGGMMVQVITAPGFRPGAEIGVDHHLRAINESLELEGGDALPFHVAASDAAVVK